jgi:hypothetical protein
VFSDERIQRYARALYPVCFLLVFVPLADLTLRAFPPQFGSLQWRFGIVGLLLGNFGTILLGTGLMGFVAAINGHRRFLRTLGYIALVLAAVILAILALFALDAIQMRQLANVNYKRTVLFSSIGAMFAGLFGVGVLLSVGLGALAASRGTSSASERRGRAAASPLLVAKPGAGEA